MHRKVVPSYNRLISTMEFPILLYIELGSCVLPGFASEEEAHNNRIDCPFRMT